MLKVFDAVLVSNDMSLDRVLNAGLPVMMIFHDGNLSADLRQALDDLARQYAGSGLLVTLARSDAPQAVSRFRVRRFPTLVMARAGKTMSSQEDVRVGDLEPHIAYLLGKGPRPTPRAVDRLSESPKQAAARGPIPVNEANFEREVLQASRPVLVDFWAPWCAPCRMVAPTLERLAQEQAKVLKIVKVNVDENPGLAGRYGAMSIPTMLVIKGGREVDRWVGALPENTIRSRVARWIWPEQKGV
jgi:thioredoxin 1